MADLVYTAGKIVTATFIRPADTTAYAAGQVVNTSKGAGTLLTFEGPTQGAFGLLQSATLISSANQATKLDCRLFVFDATLAAQVDGAAWTPSGAEIAGLMHAIAFPASSWVVANAGAGAAGNAFCNAQALELPVRADANNRIYGVLVANAAYTPVSAETFTVRLGIVN